MFGMNDALNNFAPSVVVGHALQFCESMAAAGKIPVILGITSVPLGTPGNEEGVISARVVVINQAVKAAVEGAGYHSLDISTTISTSPGVANDLYMTSPTNLHPSS